MFLSTPLAINRRWGDGEVTAAGLDAEAGHTGEGDGVCQGVQLVEDVSDFFQITICFIQNHQ